MMIGPAPMMRIDWMSVRLGMIKATYRSIICGNHRPALIPGMLHHGYKAIKKIIRFMRSGACLRVTLKTKSGFIQ